MTPPHPPAAPAAPDLPAELAAVPGDELARRLADASAARRAMLSLLEDFRRSEEALRASQALLNATGEIARIGGWEFDVVALTLRWTDQVFHLHDVPKDHQPDVKRAIEFYHPEDRPKIAAAVQECIAHGTPYDLELRLITAKGRALWVRSLGRADRPEGRTVRIYGTFQDITEIKQTRTRLDELVTTVDGIVWEAEAATFRFTYVSPQADRLLGYPVNRWLDEPGFWAEHIHPEDRAAAVAFCETESRAGRNYSFEYRMLAADGRAVWLHDIVTVVTESGVPRYLRGIMVDITARKQVEERLREQDRYLAGLVANLPGMVYRSRPDTDRTMLYVSDGCLDLTGYRKEELEENRAVSFGALVHPEDRGALGQKSTAALAARQPCCNEYRLVHRSGEARWVWDRAFGVYADDGRLLTIEGFVMDITDRRRAAAALEDAEARWRFALEGAGDGVWDWDIATGRVTFSARWKSMLGYAEDEIGPDLDEWNRRVHPDDLPAAFESLARHFHGETPYNAIEHRMLTKSGVWKWILARGRVVARDAAGRPLRMIGTHTDIDERKQTEQTARELSERLTLALSAARLAVFRRNLRTGEGIWDARMWELYGLPPQPQALSLTETVARVHPDDRDRFVAGIGRLADPGDAYKDELRVVQPDGGVRYVAMQAIPQANAEGRSAWVIGVAEDISQRVLRDTERRRLTERLQLALHGNRYGVWEFTFATGRLMWDEEMHAHYGVRPGEFRETIEHWQSHILPEDLPAVQQAFAAVLAGPSPVFGVRFRIRRSDGAVRLLDGNGTIERDAQGAPLRAVGMNRDITDVAAAEEKLRRVGEHLQLALSASRLGIWRANVRTGEMEWDARVREIFGHPEGAPLPADMAAFIALVDPADRDVVRREWTQVVAGRASFNYQFRVVRPDGAVRHVRSMGTVQPGADGRPEWVTGVNEDVTDAVQAQARERDSAEMARLAVRAANLGIFRYHVPTDSSDWNGRMLELYGVDRPANRSQLAALLHPDDRARLAALWAGIGRGERTFDFDFRIVRRDGRTAHLHAECAVTTDAAGAPEWVSGINRDITAEVEAAGRRRQLEQQLVQTQKLETLGTLAGGIAHDFNNLLTGIIGFVELSQKTVPARHEAQDFLRQARAGGLRARDLVKRLLLFARRAPDAPRQTLRVAELVRETIPLLTATLPPTAVIRTELHATERTVVGDGSQLQQVLMNLCVNAAQAIGERPGHITVTVQAADVAEDGAPPCKAGPHVCLSVADDGPGMDAATQARIFDPFFTTKPQGQGTGLGLAIVHGIVADHGGCIRVESEPGRGTRFDIFLPAGAAATGPVAESAAALPPLFGLGRRILLADDDENVRMLVGAVLLRLGFVLEVCTDGQAAVQRFAATPGAFALALLDLSMPGLTGHAVIERLHAQQPDLPIVLMSGDHGRYEVKPGTAGTFVPLLKPFSQAELLAALRQALGDPGPGLRR